ncbi:MAG: hypothetical protein S4CHLAM2_11170 [Chlamydiales bacterium]|nr:hypothetical protein [Chlamydiales bacterium]
MKKALVALGLLMAMAQPTLSADYRYSDYNCCEEECIDWCNGWDVYADYLYWNVRKCNLDYLVGLTANANEAVGSIQKVCPDYTSGFRVGFNKSLCDWEAGVKYTHLRLSDGSSAAFANGGATRFGQAVAGPIIGPVSAQAGYSMDLDVVDLEVGHTSQPWCKTAFRFFGGVKLARIDQKLDVTWVDTGTATVLTQKNKVDMHAYGLYAGVRGLHDFFSFCGCGNLGIYGSLACGTLVGDFDRSLLNRSDAQAAAVTNINDDCYRLLANLKLAAGLVYTLSDFFCGSLAVSVGYEMDAWINTSDFLQLNYNADEVGDVGENYYSYVANSDNLGFDGLVVRVAVGF